MVADKANAPVDKADGVQGAPHGSVAEAGAYLSRPAETAALKPKAANLASIDGANAPVITGDPASTAVEKERFAGFGDLASAQKAAADRGTTPKVLAKLADLDDPEVKTQVAKNTSTTPDVIDRLANDPDIKVRRGAAENSSAAIDTLIRLRGDGKESVRILASITMQDFAAEETRSPEDLAGLADSKDGKVLLTLARNRSTPADTLDFIASTMTDSAYPDQGVAARRAVAENESAPVKSLIKLADDESIFVKNTALRHISDFVYSPHTSNEIMTELANSNNPEISLRVARSKFATPEMLTHLASDKEESVRDAVLDNASTPGEVKAKLLQMQQELAEHKAAAVKDPSTSPEELRKIAAGDWKTNPYLDDIARHPNAPPDILLYLSDSPRESVRINVAGNESTPGRILGSFLRQLR